MQNAPSGLPAPDSSWRQLYILGAAAAILVVALTLTDIVLTLLPGWETTTVPGSVEQWFRQFQTSPWLGLRNLDLLNLIVAVVSIPLYVALYGAHRRVSQGYAQLGLVLFAIGTALFCAGNAALPMYTLAQQAATGAPPAILYGAAAALLAQGAHGSMGAFPGFFLSTLGTFCMAWAMLQGRVFARRTAYVGLVGIGLLTVYIVGVTFLPAGGPGLMAVALPGGLLMIAWHMLVAMHLLRLTEP